VSGAGKRPAQQQRCNKPLADGLHFESEMFGECCATEDMRIGVGNFLANGPRSKAEFVHR